MEVVWVSPYSPFYKWKMHSCLPQHHKGKLLWAFRGMRVIHIRERRGNKFVAFFLFTNFLVHLVFLRQRTETVLCTDVKKKLPRGTLSRWLPVFDLVGLAARFMPSFLFVFICSFPVSSLFISMFPSFIRSSLPILSNTTNPRGTCDCVKNILILSCRLK